MCVASTGCVLWDIKEEASSVGRLVMSFSSWRWWLSGALYSWRAELRVANPTVDSCTCLLTFFLSQQLERLSRRTWVGTLLQARLPWEPHQLMAEFIPVWGKVFLSLSCKAQMERSYHTQQLWEAQTALSLDTALAFQHSIWSKLVVFFWVPKVHKVLP